VQFNYAVYPTYFRQFKPFHTRLTDKEWQNSTTRVIVEHKSLQINQNSETSRIEQNKLPSLYSERPLAYDTRSSSNCGGFYFCCL